MVLNLETYGTAMQPGFVAPTFGGALAGVCPQAGLFAVDTHAVKISRNRQVTVPSAGTAAGMGHRSWSPPI